MSKQFLDNSGLQIVADKVKTRLKTVTTMPQTANPGAVRLYVGEDTVDYKKGHIYKATGNYWYCYRTRGEEYIYIKNKFPPEVNDYFWAYFLNGLWVVPSDESQLEETNIITRVIAKGRVIDIDVSGYETNIRYPQYDINNLVWQDITAGGGTADLNFDPTSQNAQSGIAVSQALKMVVSDNTKTDWEDAPWLGDFWGYGSRIWIDGDNVYYSDGGSQYALNRLTNTWEPKTWQGFTELHGEYIWTDGTNIYYSSDSTQKVLNKATSTWENKTWQGLTTLYGNSIWTDGNNIYYSYGSNQYVLNKTTSTWEPKTWNGYNISTGSDVWTDGTNIYYSSGSTQYVLNKATDTWENKTWNGLSDFRGSDVWTDGTNIYYSYYDVYTLDEETSTWEITNPWGSYIVQASYVWELEDSIYVSGGDYEQKQMIRTIK